VKVKVQTLDGKAAKNADIELSDAVFGIEPRADFLHRFVTWQLESRRGTARGARERSDVARTGKKWGKQKGGGTARHGDRAAPIFVGGGKAHGPRVRDFNPSLNKKIRALGLKMALSAKAKDGLVVVDTLDIKDAKTKALAGQLAKAGWGKKVLVIDGESVNDNFARAAGNLKDINVLPAIGANVYDILKHDTLVLTRAAVEKLEARFALPGGANYWLRSRKWTRVTTT
jgi:large subunit ribosomal protein L4